MQAANKKILFISHEASLSGATLVLYELMKWIKQHEQIEMALLLKADGPIKAKFEEVCEVHPYDFPVRLFNNRVSSFLYNRFIWPRQKASYRNQLLQKLLRNKFDLIYANTAGVGEILSYLEPLGVKVVSHIHELEYVMECIGAENMKRTIRASSSYIAVSEQVKENLAGKYEVDAAKITVLPPFVDFMKIDAGAKETDTETVRKELGIPVDGFVVGGAGSIEWRKGADIFVEVAIQVLAKIPDAYFIWVGKEREANLIAKLNYDIKKAGLEKNIKFIGPRKNPYPYYMGFNLFLLTSREDPYPLVCLENIYLNKPVICFEKSGGAASLISSYNCGESVPYLDIDRMAAVVTGFATGPAKQAFETNLAALKAAHAVENVAPKILEAMFKGN